MLYLHIANSFTNGKTGLPIPTSNCITSMLKGFISIMTILLSVIIQLMTLVYYYLCSGANHVADDRLNHIFVEKARLFLIKISLAFLPECLLISIDMRTALCLNMRWIASLCKPYLDKTQCVLRRWPVGV